MRPKRQVLSAAGNAPWVPVNYRGSQFGVGIGVALSNGATLTYSIQHTFDDPQRQRPVVITRAGTTATVTFQEPHGLVVGDSVVTAANREPNFDGTHAVTAVPDSVSLQFTVADTGATIERCEMVTLSVFEHDQLTAQTTTQDGNYAFPPSAMRLVITAHTSGQATANYNYLSR